MSKLFVAIILLASLIMMGCEHTHEGDTITISADEGSTINVEMNNAEGTNNWAGSDSGNIQPVPAE